MPQTRFCDSAGLHALLGARRRARLKVARSGSSSPVRLSARILAIMAIDRVIPVFGRLDEALTPPARSDLSG